MPDENTVYFSSGGNWQAGEAQSLNALNPALQDTLLTTLPLPITLEADMIPQCRYLKLGVCQPVKTQNNRTDVFVVRQMADDRLNYAVDATALAESLEDTFTRQQVFVDAGSVSLNNVQLANNVLAFTLADVQPGSRVRMILESQQGFRKAVLLQASTP